MTAINEIMGEVFSIAKDNQPVIGCTISKAVYKGMNEITYFSLAGKTDISAEIFPYHKLIIVAEGNMEIYGTDGFRKALNSGDSFLTPMDTPMGMRSDQGAIYTEISIRKDDIMNEAIKAGENFHFSKAGLHSVKATKQFKMALLLTLE